MPIIYLQTELELQGQADGPFLVVWLESPIVHNAIQIIFGWNTTVLHDTYTMASNGKNNKGDTSARHCTTVAMLFLQWWYMAN